MCLPSMYTWGWCLCRGNAFFPDIAALHLFSLNVASVQVWAINQCIRMTPALSIFQTISCHFWLLTSLLLYWQKKTQRTILPCDVQYSILICLLLNFHFNLKSNTRKYYFEEKLVKSFFPALFALIDPKNCEWKLIKIFVKQKFLSTPLWRIFSVWCMQNVDTTH